MHRLSRRALLGLTAGLGLAACASAGLPLSVPTEQVRSGDALLMVRSIGSGPAVIMIPSVGRATSDFNALAERVAAAGFRVILPEPRGTAGSTGLRPDLTLSDYGGDIVAVADHYHLRTATLLGHAAGARDARVAIGMAPERFPLFVSLATGAGGGERVRSDVGAERAAALHARIPDAASFSDAERLEALRTLYFAPGNDASVWLRGWWPEASRAHGAAARATPRDQWWPGRPVEALIVEAADDVVAPPEGDVALRRVLGDRATVVSLPNAGHAMLPEQPAAIAAVVTAYLRGRRTGLQGVVDAAAHQRPAQAL